MILAIVQARCSSTRLPGKVMAPVLGRAMILRQLERLDRSLMIDRLVVATSTDASDDSLVELLQAEGVTVRRGSLDDVAGRFQSVVREFAPTTVVRLTADCPLADPVVIDHVIREHLKARADYTSNTLQRTYPQGLDVECVSTEAFDLLMIGPLEDSEREHVTIGIYNHPEVFSLHSVTQQQDVSNLRWTVDRPDDLAFVRTVYESLYSDNPEFDQQDILNFLQLNPSVSHTNR
ncbi:MAG TPA: glycosyltransferase family protein [Terrimesophilobacter sp.]|nr:glycosyltransferase family protein [Terrimesophilobacter sp.]